MVQNNPLEAENIFSELIIKFLDITNEMEYIARKVDSKVSIRLSIRQ
jgi:hypothetical protein